MPRPRRIIAFAGLAAPLMACAGSGEGGDELSSFSEDTALSGRVLENTTACVVDAMCQLRIEFSDTTIVAVYGSGERPASDCEPLSGVSDLAFQAAGGDLVEVVVSRCEAGGHYLRQLALLND